MAPQKRFLRDLETTLARMSDDDVRRQLGAPADARVFRRDLGRYYNQAETMATDELARCNACPDQGWRITTKPPLGPPWRKAGSRAPIVWTATAWRGVEQVAETAPTESEAVAKLRARLALRPEPTRNEGSGVAGWREPQRLAFADVQLPAAQRDDDPDLRPLDDVHASGVGRSSETLPTHT